MIQLFEVGLSNFREDICIYVQQRLCAGQGKANP